MELETIRAVFGWAAVIGYALLVVWFGLWVAARGWMMRMHGRWFRISEDRFALIHYSAMAAFKLALWLFLLAPWLALHIVG